MFHISRTESGTLILQARMEAPGGVRGDFLHEVQPGEAFGDVPYEILKRHVGKSVAWDTLRKEAGLSVPAADVLIVEPGFPFSVLAGDATYEATLEKAIVYQRDDNAQPYVAVGGTPRYCSVRDYPEDAPRVEHGDRYRHYKGGTYKAVGVVLDDASGEPCVTYRAEKDDRLWVRSAEDFFATVTLDTGAVVPRFSRVLEGGV